MKRFWQVVRILLLGFAGTAFAAPFQNGSFEIGASSTCGAGDNLLAGSTAIPGWTVSVGSIDWASSCNWASQDGTHSLDLIGGGASAVSSGGVRQTFDTVPGGTYQVSFYLAANPSTLFGPVVKPLTVTVADGTTSNTITTQSYTFDRSGHDGSSAANMGWAQRTFTFVATGSTSTINFVSDISPATSFAGAALDNVSITLINAPPFQNGSFEIGASSTCGAGDNLLAGSTAIPGWRVSVGSIDWASSCNWASQDGTHSLDLIGGGASAVSSGGVQQTFGTIPGTSYQVSFYLAANPSTLFGPVVKPLTVTVADGTTSNTITTQSYTFDRSGHDGSSAANMGWAQRTFTFVATGSTSTINFVSDISPATSFAGAALDNVSIAPVLAATTTGLFSSQNPSSFGSAVTFTVQVLGTINSPTGTIAFTDNGSPIAGCTAVPLGPTGSPLIATADCIAPLLAIGSHTIAATYSGDVVNAGSGNTLTQVVNPVVIGATPWTGSAGVVVNPGQGGIAIGSAPTVVSDGTTGPAVFTYATVNDYCCHTGDWTFETIATTTGPVTLNWSYSGYHGTCQAVATLTPYAKNNGGTTFGAPVYSAADNCTGQLPSGGFGMEGQITLFVDAGYAYGFTMHASNYDSNGGVRAG